MHQDKIDLHGPFDNSRRNSGKLMSILFQKMKPIIERYINHTDGDLPFFYNERANVGLLAAAAWAAGAACIEEYRTNKSHSSDIKKKVYGRGDLYISFGEEVLLIEAKNNWIFLKSRRSTIESQFSKSIEKAIKDAQRATEDGHLIALSFFVPHLDNAERLADPESFVRERFAELENFVTKLDGKNTMASYRIKKYEDMFFQDNKRGLMVWPGMIVVASELRN